VIHVFRLFLLKEFLLLNLEVLTSCMEIVSLLCCTFLKKKTLHLQEKTTRSITHGFFGFTCLHLVAAHFSYCVNALFTARSCMKGDMCCLDMERILLLHPTNKSSKRTKFLSLAPLGVFTIRARALDKILFFPNLQFHIKIIILSR
jgi:hypothetical protein